VRSRFQQNLHLLLAAGALAFSTGCPAISDLPAPGAMLTQQEPDGGREYHLYVPSHYRDEQRWPLVVTCHGTNPFDSARAQRDEWKGIAETKGFLVVAPELVGTSALPAKVDEQISRQAEDEKAILSIVRGIRAARSIDETRIFLTGWSAGAYAVLYTGLRHPDLFRALALRQGNFKPEFVEVCIPFIDRYQPILVTYGNLDPLVPKEQAEASIEWLRSNEMRPEVKERAGAHRRDPQPVYEFFADVVKNRPWIRILVEDDPRDPMHVKFSVRSSFEPVKYLWDFGDHERSPVAAPDHRYDKPAMYTVRVALYTAGDKPYVRQIHLQMPRIRLGVQAATEPATHP